MNKSHRALDKYFCQAMHNARSTKLRLRLASFTPHPTPTHWWKFIFNRNFYQAWIAHTIEVLTPYICASWKGRLASHRNELKSVSAHFWRVTFKHLPQQEVLGLNLNKFKSVDQCMIKIINDLWLRFTSIDTLWEVILFLNWLFYYNDMTYRSNRRLQAQ
jgi:hypothetical protein